MTNAWKVIAVLLIVVICTIELTTAGHGHESISECNNDKKVPYRAIVNDDGTVEISCRFVDCVNNSKNEVPICETKFHTKPCSNFPAWLHGVRQPNAGKGRLESKCCTYQRLLYGKYLGTTVLHKRQGFLGGFHYIKGQENTNKREGFDVITNMTKEGDPTKDGGYRIWVHRMHCLPPPPQQQKASQNDYFDTKAGSGNPSIDYQTVQIRDQNGNPQTVPIIYSSGCFEASTTVYTETRGPIAIDQLRVGENVLTVHGKTSSYRPVSFFLHRDPRYTARYLTLHTEKPDVSVTMTPHHIIFSDECSKDPARDNYPQKFANEVRPGQCLMLLDRESGRLERVRVNNVSESYRRGIYSPITPNGVIVTNDLVSSCYSFIKNQDLQASLFYYMMRVEDIIQNLFALPSGWLLGGHQTRVDVPRGLDRILTALDHILPVSKLF